MEREIELQFSQEVLFEAARRFGLSSDSLKLLGDFENYVYEGKVGGVSLLLPEYDGLKEHHVRTYRQSERQEVCSSRRVFPKWEAGQP